VPFKGHLAPYVYQLVGGVRAGMGYCGCKTLDELRTKARFIQVTAASVQESHPHDIAITQEAPNYSPADHTRAGAASPGCSRCRRATARELHHRSTNSRRAPARPRPPLCRGAAAPARVR
jgi:hypothetical protein